MNDRFIVIQWPEIMEFQEMEGFEMNSELINGNLYSQYGDSAYFVRESWLKENAL